MAMSFRSSTYAEVGADGSSLTISRPSGVVDGDLLIYWSVTIERVTPNSALLFKSQGAGVDFTSLFPAGLKTVYSENDTHRVVYIPYTATGAYGFRHFFAPVYRIASSEPATYEFDYKRGGTGLAFTKAVGTMVCYQGYTGWPLGVDYEWYDSNAPPQGTSRASGTSWDAPSIAADPDEPLLSFGYSVAATSATMAPPSGMTERTDNWQSGSGFLTSLADRAVPSNPTGIKTFTSSVAGTRGLFVSVAKPLIEVYSFGKAVFPGALA